MGERPTMAHYDDLNTKQIWIVGLVSTVLTGVTILAVQVLYFALLTSFEESRLATSEYTSSTAALAEQDQSLNSYSRNPENNRISIPIDRAMNIVIERSKGAAEAAPQGEGEKGNDNA